MMKNIFKINVGNNRIYGLDILRCFAILAVMFEHGNFFLPANIGYYFEFIRFDGVNAFFVLSGFLVGGILIKTIEENGHSVKTLFNFWNRRWYRTFPVYFLILLLLTIKALFDIPNFEVHMVSEFFFFSQNLFSKHIDWFFPEAWSISIEEWFYFIIPIFVFIILKLNYFDKKRTFLYIAIYLIGLIILFRMYRYNNMQVSSYTDWDSYFRKQVITRIDSIMFGVIGAYIFHYYEKLWFKYKYQLFFLGIFVLLFPTLFFRAKYSAGFGLYLCVFSFAVNSFAVLLLLPLLSSIRSGRGKVYSCVMYISLISYSMYLINLSIVLGWIVAPLNFSFFLNYEPFIKYLLYWLLTILLSILLYKYYELPCTSLRDRKNAAHKPNLLKSI